MKKITEVARVFFISPEFLLVVIGVAIQMLLAKSVDHVITEINISDDFLKWAIAIPGALLCWSLVSGRKLLFPEKDKKSILQKWPDYWILKICFHVALAWNLIFVLISIYAWTGDWKHPSADHFISLAISIIGSAMCSFSIYNAQTRVEEEISQYVEKS
ncbi:hypothetical protein [Burkholderia pseudomallei]|uniref:hypothetical protein n=1 Tax=Burkholderia pseudomallei TaxID=28450 RepID=UPI00050DAD6F|nr:hypothetical protein [Burkholderia pseudomallei]KGC61455.1 putative membrane protein [Burkholderia pseudomallei]